MHNEDDVENALEKINYSFSVLHEEFFCLKDVVIEVDVVDLKIPIDSEMESDGYKCVLTRLFASGATKVVPSM